ncbi:putative DNA/RNA-binding protein Alba [Lupinus albus]|uniref:Putative DNA/RNA-binding protein Alba n=1 Tax=Lupinus albus TaxID=3870 RepID=A0A6A4PMF4_LUPAL|nr:putative DNA/RNA-binding protein Alba [Lupinus albus]
MQHHNEVELSALGIAIANMVTIAEILRNDGLSVENKIIASFVDIKDDSGSRFV